jgi:hypothetical protein
VVAALLCVLTPAMAINVKIGLFLTNLIERAHTQRTDALRPQLWWRHRGTDPGGHQHGAPPIAVPHQPFTLAITPNGKTLYVT